MILITNISKNNSREGEGCMNNSNNEIIIELNNTQIIMPKSNKHCKYLTFIT